MLPRRMRLARRHADEVGVSFHVGSQAMKPSALLVNTSRAELVAAGALQQALAQGRPGYAALDVFETEPLPPEHPLWREPRALLTPHVAVVGPYIPQRRLAVLCDNARRFMAGEPLHNRVDKALWY